MYNDENDYLFTTYDLDQGLTNTLRSILEKVETIPENQFRSMEREEIIESIRSELEIVPLVIYEDRKTIEGRETEVEGRMDYGRDIRDSYEPYMVKGIEVTVSIPFTGDPELWRCKPNSFMSSVPRGRIIAPDLNGIGYIVFIFAESHQSDLDKRIQRRLNEQMQLVQKYQPWVNKEVESFNSKLDPQIMQAILAREQRLGNLDHTLKSLGIPLKKKQSDSLSIIPLKRRFICPVPPMPDESKDWAISTDDYEFILDAIRQMGRTFETTPSSYQPLGEEDQRNIMLASLNTHYKGAAKGEVFRKNGKTDIFINFNNKAAFVAECKIWAGKQSVLDVIDQLLGYLVWRDTKTSLVILNRDRAEFQELIKKLSGIVCKHDNYLATDTTDEQGEWRYRFKSADDPETEVTIHVFLFNLYTRP